MHLIIIIIIMKNFKANSISKQVFASNINFSKETICISDIN